jgi:chromosome segregation ATPase
MTQTSEPTEETTLKEEIDRLSLEQALRDFEIANARVVDLTQRLISSNDKVISLQRDLDILRVEMAELRATHEAMQGSAGFRIASRIWALRNAVRL